MALLAGVLALGIVTACDDGEPLTVGDTQLDAALAEAMESHVLRSMLVRVTVDGEPRYERALGESIAEVPASLDMHLRIGAFGFTLMSTLLMVLVDNGDVTLEDPLSNWFPTLPQADAVTLRDLAQMTSGYADYVYQPAVLEGFGLNPFREWTSDELIEIGLSVPLQFDPGTNWAYSHTNYVILGRVLEEVTGMPLDRALRRFVLLPMHTTTTTLPSTSAMPEPVLHSFSSERRFNLEIPDDLPFYEDATFWNPSWTTAPGAVGVATIADLTTIMEEVGIGALLSEESFREQTGPSLVGFGHAEPGCAACSENTVATNYALGIPNRGSWMTQSMGFAGQSGTGGYTADGEIGLAVVTTFLPEAWNAAGDYTEAANDASVRVFLELAELLAPGSTTSPQSA